jgi:hypothetical protein
VCATESSIPAVTSRKNCFGMINSMNAD